MENLKLLVSQETVHCSHLIYCGILNEAKTPNFQHFEGEKEVKESF